MGWLSKILSPFRARQYTEGAYREGPYYLPYSGGWLSAEAGKNLNWWQMGYDLHNGGRSHMIEACVSAYAQTTAMCPGNHWIWDEKNGRTRQTTSALSRLMKTPNAYQSISDFLLNLIYSYYDGNAYALALRNNRNEIIELHLFDQKKSYPVVAENGDVFYVLSGNEVIEKQLNEKSFIVPSRDVLHLRGHCPRHPLVGESPMVAAAFEIAAGNAALLQQITFYANQARPSFVLTTDQVLSVEQVRTLRLLWEEQSKGLAQGGTPILSAGLKAQPISSSAKDSQLAEILGMTDQAIANVYRVPLQILGIGNSTFSSTEALMNYWLASGLGFLLNHIEEAFGQLFGLKGQPEEYLELDTSALQRTALKERVEAWVAGTKGGVFARNEARQEFELKPVEGGDEPWVQQQDLPLSVAIDNAKNPPKPPTPAPAPQPPVDNTPPEPDKEFSEEFLRHFTEKLDAA